MWPSIGEHCGAVRRNGLSFSRTQQLVSGQGTSVRGRSQPPEGLCISSIFQRMTLREESGGIGEAGRVQGPLCTGTWPTLLVLAVRLCADGQETQNHTHVSSREAMCSGEGRRRTESLTSFLQPHVHLQLPGHSSHVASTMRSPAADQVPPRG